MNVKLAAQLLSESVANSLRFCLQEQISNFEGCEATIKFIMMFNTIFDIMNSRNLIACNFKAPIQKKNSDEIKDFLVKAENYIRSLKLSDGQEVLKSNRKTGFLGFLFCIRSIQILHENLIAGNGSTLKFLMTYKLSQDHIALFFGKIRNMGGCNNNPTVRQFAAAYKKLLVHNDMLEIANGNCLPLESVPILTVSSQCNNAVNKINTSLVKHSNNAVNRINTSLVKHRVQDEKSTIERDISGEKDYIYIPSASHLSKCSDKIVAYISGFVVHSLGKSLHCEACIGALTVEEATHSSSHSLINLKNKGTLIYPTDDVISICLTSEKLFREATASMKGPELRSGSFHFHRTVSEVLQACASTNIFCSLNNHMYDTEPFANHLHLLIMAVAEKYLQVRSHYNGKQITAMLQKKVQVRSRQSYTKLIHFTGQ